MMLIDRDSNRRRHLADALHHDATPWGSVPILRRFKSLLPVEVWCARHERHMLSSDALDPSTVMPNEVLARAYLGTLGAEIHAAGIPTATSDRTADIIDRIAELRAQSGLDWPLALDALARKSTPQQSVSA